MPGFPKILKKWIADCYDYLGLVLVCSFVWFGTFLAGMASIMKVGRHVSPLVLAIMICALYVLVLAPLAAGVFSTAKKIVTRDDPSPLDVFRGFKEFLVPGWKLGACQVLITLMIVANAWFYLTRSVFILKALGIVVVYVLILWLLSAMYHFPVLIEQRPGAWKNIKRGFLLSLDNAAFTLGMFFVIILLTCFSAATLLGLPLLYLGMVSILQTRALRVLFVKYEILAPEREYRPEDVSDTFALESEHKETEPVLQKGK